MSPTIRFTVAIQPDPNWLLLEPEQLHAALESQRSIYIPGLSSANNFTGKNNDYIVLSGLQAIYYKKLIDSGQIKDLIYDRIVVQPAPPPPESQEGPINGAYINKWVMAGGGL